MKKHKAIRYLLHETPEQAEFFNKMFGCCLFVWNKMLEDNVKVYKETKEILFVQPSQYKPQYPFLYEADSLALSNERQNLINAFKRFWNRKITKVKFPKFKSKDKMRKSYVTSCVNGNIRIGDNFIRLPKIGEVKATIYRQPEENWKLKTVTISQDSVGRYYASVTFEYDEPQITYTPDLAKAIGLDYKSDGLYMDSNGNLGTNHKYFKESQKALAKEQTKLKNKQRGSKRYKKQQQKIARIYKHATNQRKDNLHKISRKLVDAYDVICVETLNLNVIAQSFKLGKATMDNGFGMLIRYIEYKAKELGKLLVKIDWNYASSQICSHCGNKQQMPPKVRTYNCPNCGTTIDRDLNAAINILNEGLRKASLMLTATP